METLEARWKSVLERDIKRLEDRREELSECIESSYDEIYTASHFLAPDYGTETLDFLGERRREQVDRLVEVEAELHELYAERERES